MAFDPVLPIGNSVAIQPADFRRAAVGNTMTHDILMRSGRVFRPVLRCPCPGPVRWYLLGARWSPPR